MEIFGTDTLLTEDDDVDNDDDENDEEECDVCGLDC